MKQSEAWIIQVRSDFNAAERLLIEAESKTYCQAISKYQQTVEKSVKAMVAAVNDLGILFMTITPSHLPDKEIKALRSLRRAIDILDRMFERHSSEIERLCKLAPHWPDDGKTFLRNTEYPFSQGTEWIAPAEDGVFTIQEVKLARDTAWVFHRNAINFVQSVRRRKV